METGVAQLKDRWRWLGRRYFGGLLQGFGSGVMLGGLLGLYAPTLCGVNVRGNFAFLSVAVVSLTLFQFVLGALAWLVLGRPPAIEVEENGGRG